MYHTHQPACTHSGAWLPAVVAALEIPDCDCAVDLACPCEESCLVGPSSACHGCVLGEGVSGPLASHARHLPCAGHCPHCRGECDCKPAAYQPLCRHMIDAAADPALQRWLALVAEHAPADGDAALRFEAEQLCLLLLDHAADDYRDRPRPPLPLMARSWNEHVAELGRREGKYSLWGRSDADVLAALRIEETAHNSGNGRRKKKAAPSANLVTKEQLRKGEAQSA